MRVKSEAKRQAILEVAREAFTRQGFETTSMSAIASAVGGSKATLYNHFSSKEALFEAVMLEFGRRMRIAEAFEELDATAALPTQLQRLGKYYLCFMLHPEVMALRTVVLHEAARSQVGRRFYALGPEKGWKLFSQFLSSHQARLAFDDPWICAMHFKGLLEAELIEPCSLGARPMPADDELDRVVSRAVRVFLAAYGRGG
ncbi:TetR/AcrR family transcriptional regulator [Pseudaeromonas paramecii]|uniref:TetR family multidrug efflux transcriptional regulator VceR n=1 Tax=Pseudaeromonas paramecii TaxID=2138166 RepID=A0ABP8QCV2_9GAMM